MPNKTATSVSFFYLTLNILALNILALNILALNIVQRNLELDP
jgi:hypothetical protein